MGTQPQKRKRKQEPRFLRPTSSERTQRRGQPHHTPRALIAVTTNEERFAPAPSAPPPQPPNSVNATLQAARPFAPTCYSRMLFSPAFLDSAWMYRMMRKAHGMRVPRKMARYAGKVTVMPSASISDDGTGTDASGSSDAVLWACAQAAKKTEGVPIAGRKREEDGG